MLALTPVEPYAPPALGPLAASAPATPTSSAETAMRTTRETGIHRFETGSLVISGLLPFPNCSNRICESAYSNVLTCESIGQKSRRQRSTHESDSDRPVHWSSTTKVGYSDDLA